MKNDRYEQLKKITCFSPLGNLLIKKNASAKQYKLFTRKKISMKLT